MRPLFVLFWKHFVTRKRKCCGTFVEYFFSVPLIFILYWMRNTSGSDIGPAALKEKVHDQELQLRRILYTPKTELTNLIMDQVGSKLLLPRLDVLPEKGEVGISGFYSLPDRNYLRNMGDLDAIVIFQDNMNESLPKKLNYTIQLGNDFYPSPPYFPLGPDSMIVPLFANPYILRLASLAGSSSRDHYERVLRLQWAIDTTYLHKLTGADTNQTLKLQGVLPLAAPKFPQKLGLANNACLVCESALLLLFTFLMSSLLSDKNSGIQELIKMEGVSINTICLAQFMNVLPGGLVYAISYSIVLKMSDTAIFPNTSSIIVFMALILHFFSVIACAFIGAYLVNTSILITTTCFFSYLIPTLFIDYVAAEFQKKFKRKTVVILTALLPHRPLNWILSEIGVRESNDEGVTFENMGTAVGAQSGSVLEGLVLMLIQFVLFTLLAWYLTQVMPGPFGQPRPCTFVCQKSFWRKSPLVETVTIEERTSGADKKYFEEPPKGLFVGIQIVNVTKKYPRHVAVSNLSLNVYKGEITVLLGHNGAGKSTIMNIITGLTCATSGKVLVNGMDTSLMQKEVRSQMGLCPQHNLFFADLTIMEHTRFFGMLKGGKYSQVKKDSRELLRMLNVLDKANNMADQLSGGMKRRLQLACSLVGGASVLILDEPTSGLDVETRRELWDLLLQLRGSRTVLLTTHFMEEADALADRIAAMHAGALVCHATPMFLKRAVGTGYRLSFTTAGAPHEAAITAVVRSSVPDATMRDHALKAISYNLPAEASPQFPALFSSLEAKKAELEIYTIGVGKSTLEEVFLELCSDCTTEFETDQKARVTVAALSLPKLAGFLLYVSQYTYLLKRQFYYVTSKLVVFAFYEAILPITIMFLLTKYTSNEIFFEPSTTSLDLYDAPERRVLHDGDSEDPLLALRSDDKIEFEINSLGAAVRSVDLEISYLQRYLVGIKLNNTNAEALYSSAVRLAAPAALTLLSNALAARSNASARARTIAARLQPLNDDQVKHKYPKFNLLAGMWVILFSIVYTNVLAGYVQLPCTERATGTRHIHLMSGCPLPVYWLATLSAHAILGTLFLIIPNAIILYFFDSDETFNNAGFLAVISFILVLGLLAICCLMYLLSVLMSAKVTYAVLLVMNLSFCLVASTISLILALLEESSGLLYNLMEVSSYTVPHHTLTLAMFEATNVVIMRGWCNLLKEWCPNTPFRNPDANYVCCTTGFKYWSFRRFHPLLKTIILACQFVVYFVLLLLADHGFFELLYDRFQNRKLKLPEPRYKDPVIVGEKNYVAQNITKPKDQITDAVLCAGIHKKFTTCFGIGRSHYAVKGLSFSVKKGECFGFLGVNGAGKSTTFKMLSGEICTSRGILFSNGCFNHFTSKTKYMRTFSYCPQFFGLDGFLTGRQNLELVLRLRGLSPADAQQEAASWIEEVGLTRYADKRVSTYSGGCARRLAAAGALCQHSDAALLDEPTAAVDLAARRRLQAAMLRAKRSKAMILASHSMDEMEALCDRIIIISAGEICALGSAAELRAQHSTGYAVTFKLFQEFSSLATVEHEQRKPEKKEPAKKGPEIKEPETIKPDNAKVPKATTTSRDPAKEAIKNQFMQEMHRKFSQCELQDDHRTTLRYHIKNVMPYSELFALIEGLKKQFPQFIEDYTLTETTLEEVFLHFAKQSLADTAKKATKEA